MGSTTAAAAGPSGADARYELAGGCYALKSLASGRFVKKEGAGYKATAGAIADAEPLRLQATALGRYLLYGKGRDFLASDSNGSAAPATEPSPLADWVVDVPSPGAFRIGLPAEDRILAASPQGDLTLGTAQGDATRFTFEKAEGCPAYPEIEANVSGDPSKGKTPYGEVTGFLEGHMHWMAFEFLGGTAHCGRPWHPYGVAYALPDCSDDPIASAETQVTDGVYTGEMSDSQVGWPTFSFWPNHHSVPYEQTYWKWTERAWRSGLRLMVNLFVDNEALCTVYPYKRNACNDMASVRLQHRDLYALQDYIDAQYGGPGKGFLRIVRDPIEARRVINDGKLALVMGIEVSRLFECGVLNDVPDCSTEKTDRQLDAVYDMGVRSLEIVNKFDNAFSGVAGDAGTTGQIVNAGNKLMTGKYWQMQTCQFADGHAHDRDQVTPAGEDRDSIFNAFAAFLPAGATPIYPAAPHCNQRGLTDLGEHLVRKMMDRKMIIDPDHMSVIARYQLLNLVESKRYPGVISSHSWSDPATIPRIYDLGGVVTPMAGQSTGFVKAWKESKAKRNDKYLFGFGYGADMNGFASQGAPRPDAAQKPLVYPFKSVDGKQTIDRQRSGERVFDINKDGVAHYGLFADWIAELRLQAGDEIVQDMARGAEAYLQTWERAYGVPQETCRGAGGRFGSKGLGQVRIGDASTPLLMRAGQPDARDGRTWRYCVQRRGKQPRGRVTAVFTAQDRVGLVASTAPGHRIAGIGPGAKASRLRGRARMVTKGVLARTAKGGTRFVYGIARGRVRWVGIASKSMSTGNRLRASVRLAGL
jgi:hypothetical protein